MTDAFASWSGITVERDGDALQIRFRDRVRLYDTDSSGLIFYGTVTRWLTNAQSELYLAAGFAPEGLAPSPPTPVVSVTVDYRAPLRLADAYEIRTWMDRVGSSSLTVAHAITRDDGELCVTASTTHVHLDLATMRPGPVPDALRSIARPTGF